MVICFTYSSNETDSKTEFYAECLLGSSLGTQKSEEQNSTEELCATKLPWSSETGITLQGSSKFRQRTRPLYPHISLISDHSWKGEQP